MRDGEYTAMVWLFGALTAAGLLPAADACLAAGSAAVAAVSCAPAAACAAIVAVARVARRELRAEQRAADLAAANERESRIR